MLTAVKNVLRGEMRKYGITIVDMATVVGVSVGTMSHKLTGKTEFTLTEARRILKHINAHGESHTIESLFYQE